MHLPPWTIAIMLLVAAGYAVPYLFLSGIGAWAGTFLFWLGFGAAVWLILMFAVFRWNVEAQPTPRNGTLR